MKILNTLVALSVIFCAISAGVFFISLTVETKKVSASLQKTTKDVDEYTTATLNATQGVLEVAAGTLNDIQTTIEKEQSSLQQANAATIKAMQDLDTLVQSADESQKQALLSMQQTLKSVQAMTEAAVPVAQQAQKDLETLQPVISQADSLLKQSTDTMAHVAGATQDIQTEIHRYVYPPPQKWYQKYILTPMKIGIRMISINPFK